MRRVVTTMTKLAVAFCSLTRLPLLARSLSTNKPFIGPRQIQIESRLKTAFDPVTFLSVENTSHGRKEDESHFKVVVVSEAFEGQRLVNRHRLVNAAVAAADEDDGNSSCSLGFHSLEIGAVKTPQEWEENSSVPASPKCKGGDGRGMLL